MADRATQLITVVMVMKLGQKAPEVNSDAFSISTLSENPSPGKPDYSEMSAEELAEAFLVALREDDELTQRKVANQIFKSIGA